MEVVVVVENGIHNHNPFHKKECKGILAPRELSCMYNCVQGCLYLNWLELALKS